MKLPETNWNHPSGATDELVEFPDEPIQRFMAWLWSTRQWRENPEMVYSRFQKLQRELADWKNEQALKAAEKKRIAEKRRAALAKARAVKAEKAAAKNGA